MLAIRATADFQPAGGMLPAVGGTYSGSDGSRMDSRHLQQTWSVLTRGGMARISTFMFGLYSLAVSMIEAGQVTCADFSAMSGRPIDSHWSTWMHLLKVMMPTSGSGISKVSSKALPGKD